MDIAIVGLGCRFPGARDPVGFWELIRRGKVVFRPIPPSRWDHALFHDASTRIPDKAYIARGAYLDDDELREFGALHFGIAPRRVQVTDPQHRILLDAVRGALQDAGYETREYPRERTGVFVGASANEHKEMLVARLRAVQLFDGAFGRPLHGAEAIRDALIEDVAPMRAFSMAGNLLNMSAAMVAQTFDLGGPALSLDAACSSALIAAHQALVNLRAGTIDLAIAGGVYVNLLPDNLVGFSRIGAISRSGECRPFDASADGFVMGEGVGAVVLKRLEDALRDGDRVYAVIKGAAANNDGKSEGPMTPRLGGQLAALRMAYRDAGFSPATVGYVEAHGTATAVGDAVEVSALRALFEEAGWSRSAGARTALGSVKANVGHTMSAAGMAGLIKATLALHRKTLPPQPGVLNENPRLELASGPFYLPREEMRWERGEQPRRAGVSSFGFGGTNAHLALEEAPERPRRIFVVPGEKPRAALLLLGGARASVVAKYARQLAQALPALEREGASLADVAYTLSRRAHGEARLAVVAQSLAALADQLVACAEALERRGDLAPDPMAPPDATPPAQLLPSAVFAQGPFPDRKIALLFPGQGAQKVGLLRELDEQVPAFREKLDQLDASIADLHGRLGGSLRGFLHAPPSKEAEARLTSTQVCQPVMAAVGLALHALLRRMGLRADVALGHSLGEFVACAAAGMLSDDECVRLVAERGLAMAALGLADPGAMASAAADADTVADAIRGIEGVVVANLNHPRQTAISGACDAVRAASARLQERGVPVTELPVSHAFHSPLMQGTENAVREAIGKIELREPRYPVISAISRQPYGDAREIWSRHATAPVDFVGALRAAAGLGARVWLQVGAGGVLTSFVRATVPESERLVNAPLASRDHDGLAQLGSALGQLWAAGVDLDFTALFEGHDVELLTLPPSPIDTQSYWAVERPAAARPPLRLDAAPPSGLEENSMDPLVALFREQVALLTQQAKVLEQQAQALSSKGVQVPELPRPPIAVPTPAAAAMAHRPAVPVLPADRRPVLAAGEIDRVSATVIASVARISAFPVEAIQPSQTLVGDLGFDSLMTVELDSDIAKAFPRAGGLPRSLLGPQTRVEDVIDHVSRALQAPIDTPAPTISAALGALASEGRELLRFSPAMVEAPLPAAIGDEPLLPAALLVTRDTYGVADSLAALLRDAGHEVRIGDAPAANEGIIHLAPLSRAEALSSPGFEPLLEAHRLARAQRQERFYAVAIAGIDELDAALGGYARSLARERPDTVVKCVQLRLEDGAKAMAQALFTELRSGNAVADVRWAAGRRYEPDLQPAPAGEPIEVGPEDVVLVTGGTRGVGHRLAQALAARGAAVALVGRTPPAQLPANAIFVPWDVTRPPGDALQAARERLGKFTILLHAAGIAEDGPACDASDASVERVLSVKLSGFWSALLATAQDPLRAIVAISSWAARFGNSGQASYAAANAALSAAIASVSHKRPGVRAMSLEYPPWEGTAMVEKIPAIARAALVERGVPFIDDASGTSAFLAALQAGVSGPILLAHQRPPRVVAHRLQVRLSREQHPFLEDHQLAGQPVLPLASALDAMASAAEQARGVRGAPLLVRDFRLRQPVRIPDAARLVLAVEGEQELAVALDAGRGPACTAFVTPGADVSPTMGSVRPVPPPREGARLPLEVGDFYSNYTFHGPRLRGIVSIEQIGPQGIVGWVKTSTPADWMRSPRQAAWTVDPLAIDGAFQLAAYWVWTQMQRAGFPVGIEEYVQLAPLESGPLRASLSLEQSNGDEVRGTIVLQSRDGRVLAVARGVTGEFRHRDPRFLIGRSRPPVPEAAPANAVAQDRTAPSSPVSAAQRAVATPVPRLDESTFRIDQFPEVHELEQRLGLATAFGLRNPYFNVHERVTNDTSVIGGRTVINWSSYNYLGLSGDAEVTRAAQEAVARYGTSVSASRVASGEKPLHRELEGELASLLGTEDSVVTVSGHGVFVTVISTLFKDGDLILHDALAHDCILSGAKLSGAKRRPFPHNDWRALERQLAQLRPHYRRVLIAIEGVYSMDGDTPDLPKLIELKKKYGCLLLVDEAHSIGVLGRTGAGVGEHFRVNRSDVELWMGTLSKSFASCGGYVCGSHQLVQFLKYSAGGFVYSVGISPANAAAALAAIRQLRANPSKVERLHERASLFLRLAKEKGIDTGTSQGSAVVPAILGNSLHALQVSDALKHRGINVQPILYPAVEETAARLRFFCTATHTEQQIRETVEVLAEEIARVREGAERATGSE